MSEARRERSQSVQSLGSVLTLVQPHVYFFFSFSKGRATRLNFLLFCSYLRWFLPDHQSGMDTDMMTITRTDLFLLD